MIVRIQVRRGTALEWNVNNTVLSSGEFGYETDTGKLKIGDGITDWNNLQYSNADIVYFSSTDFAGTGTIADPIRLKVI